MVRHLDSLHQVFSYLPCTKRNRQQLSKKFKNLSLKEIVYKDILWDFSIIFFNNGQLFQKKFKMESYLRKIC